MFDFKDKNVLIAGGSGLIGSHLISAFRKAGANVTSISRNDSGTKFDCACMDSSATEALLRGVRPDIFVNCVYDPKDHRKHLDAFLWMTLQVAEWMKLQTISKKEFAEMPIPAMADPGRDVWESMRNHAGCWQGGVIINMASIYGGVVASDPHRYEGTDMFDPREWLTYSAVKGGVVALTRELAVRYAPFDVRINCISPGGVSDNQPYAFVENYCKATPMCRMARPDDLAGPVMFLASDAARYVVGQNLVVDGGLTCW